MAMGKRGRGAFTLIELLVVVAIISVLVALLVPSLGVAFEYVQTTVCRHNLGKIGDAVITYAGKNSDYIVPGYYTGYLDKDGNPHEEWATILVNEGYLEAPKVGGEEEFSSAPSVFRCPTGENGLGPVYGDEEFPADRTDPAWGRARACLSESTGESYYVHSWYGLNMETFETDIAPFVYYPIGENPILHKLDDIAYPSDLAAAFDGVFAFSAYWMRIHARHQRGTRTNILFFDGDVKTVDSDTLPVGSNRNAPDREPFISSPWPYWRLDQPAK